MIQSWHCDYTYQTIEGEIDSYPTPLASDCFVTASSSPETSTSTGAYDGLNKSESLFLFAVLIFFVSLASWKRLSIVRSYDKTQ